MFVFLVNILQKDMGSCFIRVSEHFESAAAAQGLGLSVNPLSDSGDDVFYGKVRKQLTLRSKSWFLI